MAPARMLPPAVAAWAPLVMSVVVALTFALVLCLVLTTEIPPKSEALANVMLGTLAAGFMAAVNYWLGSSAGSAAKNALLMPKPEGPR